MGQEIMGIRTLPQAFGVQIVYRLVKREVIPLS